ncbi:MAG: N-6 DNA methylase [Deltaproteobacteria bacterium]|nr:N-6 DNA methylase [Deltaproteobacteria bacterium]MBW2165818.1 N-6 DNA methylase [Deltaproteobacteria bacterium]
METIGQYFTAQPVSDMMVSLFQQDTPNRVIDLGVGHGSLLYAAYNRYNKADFYAADIDKKVISKISERLPFVNALHIDGLSKGLSKQMKLKIGSVDIAVCNPPYYRLDKTTELKDLFNKVGLKNSTKLIKFTSDIVFLAQNLQMLKKGGELGIILPDSAFTGHEFVGLREDLLTNHNIRGIVQLPDKIFKKTEARTHILLMEKCGPIQKRIPIYQSDFSGNIGEAVNISADNLLYRMDHSYYVWKELNKYSDDIMTLGDLNVAIKRGHKTKKYLQGKNIPFFHTTSFPSDIKTKINLKNSPVFDDVSTEPGDILIARVGKRCIGKVAMVNSGNQVISDCVYRVRAPKKHRSRIFRELISDKGQQWLRIIAHGVCAQVISKRDLLHFPLNIHS